MVALFLSMLAHPLSLLVARRRYAFVKYLEKSGFLMAKGFLSLFGFMAVIYSHYFGSVVFGHSLIRVLNITVQY